MLITAFKEIQKILLQSQEPRGQITELDLSSVKIFRFTDKIRMLVEGCRNLAILKLSECELSSLQRMPVVALVGLDLSGNICIRLKDSDLQSLSVTYPNLSMLNLSDNLIQHIASLQHLKKLTRLKDLQLTGNQISTHSSYRQQVFRQMKGLELLDKLDREGQPPPYDSYSDDDVSSDQQQQSDQCDEEQQHHLSGQELDEQSQVMGSSEMGANLHKRRKYHQKQESQSDS